MEFTNLEELHAYLERNASVERRRATLSRDIRLLAEKTNDEKIKSKLKLEGVVLDFYLDEGKAKPIHSTTKKDGSEYHYPSYDEIDDDSFKYLKERSITVKNDFLIARYNQVLWNSPKPHKTPDHARATVNAYLKILQSLDWKGDDSKHSYEYFELFKNGFPIAVQVKHKVKEYKDLLQLWLHKQEYPADMKPYLIRYMLEQSEFQKEDFDGSLDLIDKIGMEHENEKTNYFQTKDIYETGLMVAQRFNTDTKIWNEKIADAIVKMAEYRMDDESRMIPLGFYQQAIPYYKAAGLQRKVREVEQKFFELKSQLKLSKFEIPLDEKYTDFVENYINVKVDRILSGNPEQILGYLLSGQDIFPTLERLKEMSKNRESFHDFVHVLRFDINNNLASTQKSDGAIENEKVFESYRLQLNLFVLPFLHRLFVEGIKHGKITYEDTIRFFKDNTWLGQELYEFDAANDVTEYTWISVIAPSLQEFFGQMKAAIKSRNPFTNFVMPIDSMTLKFEGMMRTFAQLQNVTTTVSGKGNVLREKYIEELLEDDEIKKYFNEDDRLFFSYLFVAKNGMNLRNNIAHGFFKFKDYSFRIVLLLICAFLRIGKYRMTLEDKK